MTEPTHLDARGLLCPLPVLKARKALKTLPVGAELHLLADDPAAIVDVPHYCAESGNELLRQADQDDGQLYVIRKT
jgi:tRNA 2-thiouridine synthesizing protein A